MKATIQISPRGSVFSTAGKPLKAAEASTLFGADHHLSFESARTLFSELTPARIDLLSGCASAALLGLRTGQNGGAQLLQCAYRHIGRLEAHGLVRRTPEDTVFVPFESVEIHLNLKTIRN